MADFRDIPAVAELQLETLQAVRDPAARSALEAIAMEWKRVVRLAQRTRQAGVELEEITQIANADTSLGDHDHTADGDGGVLTADRHDSYSQWDVTTDDDGPVLKFGDRITMGDRSLFCYKAEIDLEQQIQHLTLLEVVA